LKHHRIVQGTGGIPDAHTQVHFRLIHADTGSFRQTGSGKFARENSGMTGASTI